MHKNDNKKAFTIVEIIVVCLMVSLLSAVAYRLMSGSFMQFFRTQTRLTNLRAASIVMERIKYDLRLAVVDIDPPIINGNRLEFTMLHGNQRPRVRYLFSDNEIRREVEGISNRIISSVPVENFVVEEIDDGEIKMLSISIIVDKDKDLEVRSDFDMQNQIQLRTMLYPRFYPQSLSDAEKYWQLARQKESNL